MNEKKNDAYEFIFVVASESEQLSRFVVIRQHYSGLILDDEVRLQLNSVDHSTGRTRFQQFNSFVANSFCRYELYKHAVCITNFSMV